MDDKKTIYQHFSGLRFHDIRGCSIYDSENNRIGKLQDAIFKSDGVNGLYLTKFVVGGSFFEELMEDIGLKKDIDPIFTIDNVGSVAPKSIKLNVPARQLKSTFLDKDAIEENEVKLSSLGSIKLLDENGESLGNIVDIKFAEGKFNFVLGDGSFKEFLEDIGLREDIDYLLSPEYIKSFNVDAIQLSKTKEDLDIIFKESIQPQYRKIKELEKARLNSNVFYPGS